MAHNSYNFEKNNFELYKWKIDLCLNWFRFRFWFKLMAFWVASAWISQLYACLTEMSRQILRLCPQHRMLNNYKIAQPKPSSPILFPFPFQRKIKFPKLFTHSENRVNLHISMTSFLLYTEVERFWQELKECFSYNNNNNYYYFNNRSTSSTLTSFFQRGIVDVMKSVKHASSEISQKSSKISLKPIERWT